MIKKQRNKKKIYSKKRVLRGGVDTTANFDDQGVLHSILNDTQTILPKFAKKKILTRDVCNEWFRKIREHDKSSSIINSKTQGLLVDEQGELINATANARSAVKFCKENQQAQLEPQVLDLQKDIQEVPHDDNDYVPGFVSLTTPQSRFNDAQKESSLVVGNEGLMITLRTLEEKNLWEQLSSTLQELKELFAVNNRNYLYEDCQYYLEHSFYACVRILFGIIQMDREKDDAYKKDVYKIITTLLKSLKFTIISPALKSSTEGFFIGIEKHGLIFFSVVDEVTCYSLRLFDDFVNSLMLRINFDYSKTTFMIYGDKPGFPLKRLFLVLTKVGESYKKIMASCNIEPPKLDFSISIAMKQAGLPDHIDKNLKNTYDLIYRSPDPFLSRTHDVSSFELGGSKSRHKNSHKSRAKTHRLRRGSKSKSRRRSHLRARKHKKNTYKRFK